VCLVRSLAQGSEMIIKAAAIAKQRASLCQHCHRYTKQLCAGCSWLVCVMCSWTEVTPAAGGGVRIRELCRSCRDAPAAKP
jgi:hypothetical protein